MDSSLRQNLKAKAHHLKPVILIGAKGLTNAVIEETNIALDAHELIKIKIYGVERDDRKLIIQQICAETAAELVQSIGNSAVLYRKRKE